MAAIGADELPRWEAGIGIATAYGPDYRGSNEHHSYVLPIPYLVYRGDWVRADRRGVRSELIGGESVSVNISATVGLPARSDENQARAGMPDLRPTFEVGPSLNVRFYENEERDRLLSLRLPLRGVIATNLSHTESIGWIFLPNVAFDLLGEKKTEGWRFEVSAGPIYASNKYHDYYYAVRPEFATSTRPAYDARAGYSGASIGFTLSRRYPDYWFGTFLRYDNLQGTVFEDSPLMRTKHSLVFGVAISKIVARSSRKTSGDDTDKDL